MAWLKARLSDGLNPELRITDEKYNEVAILFHALQAGNVEMAVALLEAGASPHPYQDPSVIKERFPFFLYPIHGVTRLSSLSKDAKEKIINLMLEKGAGFYRPKASENVVIFKDEAKE